MNIIILTSSMADSDFISYASKAKIKPNPSNQNFYNKLIKCLSLNNKVFAVSLRPFCKGMFDEEELKESRGVEGTVSYYYTKESTSKVYKATKLHKDITSTIEEIIREENLDSFVILVDTLRFGLVKAAKIIRNNYDCKVVGVVTDNPNNLSNVKKSFVKTVLKSSNDLDAYICLTERLNKIFNERGKPYYLLEGIVEDIEKEKKLPIGEYIFFGGALYERYGVKNLVNAFHKIDSKVNFVIAGSGELQKYINDLALKDKRILYLSQVDKKMIYSLEQNALLNVNPRPYSITLDNESVPSKLIEYIASGAPTMSTVHTTLRALFPEDVLWIDDSSENGIMESLKQYLDKKDHNEDIKRAASARIRVYELYGFNTQSSSLSGFLESVRTDVIS
ncbi:MAG: glycosyltransferase [Bacilli bacterium]|nr:glycosyltransferase [Bacilli bacterium]